MTSLGSTSGERSPVEAYAIGLLTWVAHCVVAAGQSGA